MGTKKQIKKNYQKNLKNKIDFLFSYNENLRQCTVEVMWKDKYAKLYKHAKKIGYMILYNDHPDYPYIYYIGNVELKSYMRGCGLGKLLYETVLYKFGYLMSDFTSTSIYAKRIWNSLIKKYEFDIDFINNIVKIKI